MRISSAIKPGFSILGILFILDFLYKIVLKDAAFDFSVALNFMMGIMFLILGVAHGTDEEEK